MKILTLFIAFTRASLLCWGGGPASIPFVRREVVARFGWMDDETFAEVVAVGNALPGPINTKMAGYIGYKVGGIWGLLAAMAGMVLPTALLMIILLSTLTHFAEEPWAQGMTRAMVPVVGVMMAVMAWQFIEIAFKGLGKWVVFAHVIVVFPLFWFLGVHPAIVLGVLFVWAFVGHKIIGKRGGNSA
jgi:chromate transporter